MQDLLWQLKDTDSFTVYTTAAYVAVVFLFIREIADAPMLAFVSVPVLMAGGIASPAILQKMMITLAYDKDTNVAATAAVGVLTALTALVVFKWLWMLFLEYQARKTKLTPLASNPRYRR
jgi:hypothetical protein